MKRIVKKYFITTAAIFLTASITYASSCANYCAPKDVVVSSTTAEHSMDSMSLAVDGTEKSHHSGDSHDKNSKVACDDDFVVTSKTIKVKPVANDNVFLSLSLDSHAFALELSIAIYTDAETPRLSIRPIYIQNKALLI